jgi:hypothetical protein
MSSELFPLSIEHAALRTREGDYAWPREYVPRAVGALGARDYAVILLEVWIRQNVHKVTRAKMRDGTEFPVWECRRGSDEDWDAFVERCASEVLSALQRLPEQELAIPGDASVFYHLRWAIPRERRNTLLALGHPDSLEWSAT